MASSGLLDAVALTSQEDLSSTTHVKIGAGSFGIAYQQAGTSDCLKLPKEHTTVIWEEYLMQLRINSYFDSLSETGKSSSGEHSTSELRAVTETAPSTTRQPASSNTSPASQSASGPVIPVGIDIYITRAKYFISPEDASGRD